MQISCIDDFDQFDRLKETWDTVHAADPHATVFVSWAWLRGWFEAIPDGCGDWFVLAVQPDNMSPYVAFLALTIDTIQHTLQMGGNPAATHTGFVCMPEHEEKAIETFAAFMQQRLEWDRFRMRDVSDSRLDLLLKCFSSKKFNVEQVGNPPCSYIPLPATWEQYLRHCLGRRTRKNLRRFTRKMENLGEFCMTQAQADNIEHQIETILTLWQLRWGSMPERDLDALRAMSYRCFECNSLWAIVLWDGMTPIGGEAAFLDRHRRTFSPYISGWDDEFAELSPGDVLTGYGIRYAIENGFRTYDFLRGHDRYKFSFGAIECSNIDVTVTRRSVRLTVKKLRKRLRRRIVALSSLRM